MGSWGGPATLEWWANGSLCLGRFGVRVTASVTGGVRRCEAVLDPPLSENDREAFDLLIQDPLFTLRLDGDGGGDLLVDVTTVDGDRLTVRGHEDAAA